MEEIHQHTQPIFFMTIIDFFLLIVGVSNLVLALFIGLSDRRNPINIFFALFVGSLFLWSGSLILFRVTENLQAAMWFLKMSYTSVVISAASFYAFIHYFPDYITFDKFQKWILGISTPAVIFFLSRPGVLISEVTNINNVRVGVQEPIGYWIFSVYFTAYFFGSLLILYRRRTVTYDPENLSRLNYILWSILTAGILGLFFNLALPSPYIREWRYIWSGPLFTAIIALTVSYAMARYNLFNTRVVAAAVFVVSISLALLFNIFIPAPFSFQMVKVVLFFAVLFIGYLLLKSILREIKIKEHIELLAKELKKSNDELKKLDEAKSEFISIASHQLRTPLTVIRGYASLLREKKTSKTAMSKKEIANVLYSSTNQLILLVNSLLNLSRIEAGRITYKMVFCDLSKIIEEVIKELKGAAKKKQITIEREGEVKATVKADEEKIREVIFNLVDNALKYSKAGTILVREGLTSEGGVRWLRISVKDNGIGIKAEDIPKLFTKFTRTKEAKDMDINGTGIGLYFAKRVVEDHRGRIWVESEGLGKGSTFYVEIPLA